MRSAPKQNKRKKIIDFKLSQKRNEEINGTICLINYYVLDEIMTIMSPNGETLTPSPLTKKLTKYAKADISQAKRISHNSKRKQNSSKICPI